MVNTGNADNGQNHRLPEENDDAYRCSSCKRTFDKSRYNEFLRHCDSHIVKGLFARKETTPVKSNGENSSQAGKKNSVENIIKNYYIDHSTTDNGNGFKSNQNGKISFTRRNKIATTASPNENEALQIENIQNNISNNELQRPLTNHPYIPNSSLTNEREEVLLNTRECQISDRSKNNEVREVKYEGQNRFSQCEPLLPEQSGNAPYICGICTKGYFNLDEYVRHCSLHKSNPGRSKIQQTKEMPKLPIEFQRNRNMGGFQTQPESLNQNCSSNTSRNLVGTISGFRGMGNIEETPMLQTVDFPVNANKMFIDQRRHQSSINTIRNSPTLFDVNNYSLESNISNADGCFGNVSNAESLEKNCSQRGDNAFNGASNPEQPERNYNEHEETPDFIENYGTTSSTNEHGLHQNEIVQNSSNHDANSNQRWNLDMLAAASQMVPYNNIVKEEITTVENPQSTNMMESSIEDDDYVEFLYHKIEVTNGCERIKQEIRVLNGNQVLVTVTKQFIVENPNASAKISNQNLTSRVITNEGNIFPNIADTNASAKITNNPNKGLFQLKALKSAIPTRNRNRTGSRQYFQINDPSTSAPPPRELHHATISNQNTTSKVITNSANISSNISAANLSANQINNLNQELFQNKTPRPVISAANRSRTGTNQSFQTYHPTILALRPRELDHATKTMNANANKEGTFYQLQHLGSGGIVRQVSIQNNPSYNVNDAYDAQNMSVNVINNPLPTKENNSTDYSSSVSPRRIVNKNIEASSVSTLPAFSAGQQFLNSNTKFLPMNQTGRKNIPSDPKNFNESVTSSNKAKQNIVNSNNYISPNGAQRAIKTNSIQYVSGNATQSSALLNQQSSSSYSALNQNKLPSSYNSMQNTQYDVRHANEENKLISLPNSSKAFTQRMDVSNPRIFRSYVTPYQNNLASYAVSTRNNPHRIVSGSFSSNASETALQRFPKNSNKHLTYSDQNDFEGRAITNQNNLPSFSESTRDNPHRVVSGSSIASETALQRFPENSIRLLTCSDQNNFEGNATANQRNLTSYEKNTQGTQCEISPGLSSNPRFLENSTQPLSNSIELSGCYATNRNNLPSMGQSTPNNRYDIVPVSSFVNTSRPDSQNLSKNSDQRTTFVYNNSNGGLGTTNQNKLPLVVESSPNSREDIDDSTSSVIPEVEEHYFSETSSQRFDNFDHRNSGGSAATNQTKLPSFHTTRHDNQSEIDLPNKNRPSLSLPATSSAVTSEADEEFEVQSANGGNTGESVVDEPEFSPTFRFCMYCKFTIPHAECINHVKKYHPEVLGTNKNIWKIQLANNSKTFTCYKCNITFRNSEELNIHNSKHESERRNSSLDINLQSSNVKKYTYTCSICNKVYKNQAFMVKHSQTHQNNYRKCKWCNRGFLMNVVSSSIICSKCEERVRIFSSSNSQSVTAGNVVYGEKNKNGRGNFSQQGNDSSSILKSSSILECRVNNENKSKEPAVSPNIRYLYRECKNKQYRENNDEGIKKSPCKSNALKRKKKNVKNVSHNYKKVETQTTYRMYNRKQASGGVNNYQGNYVEIRTESITAVRKGNKNKKKELPNNNNPNAIQIIDESCNFNELVIDMERDSNNTEYEEANLTPPQLVREISHQNYNTAENNNKSREETPPQLYRETVHQNSYVAENSRKFQKGVGKSLSKFSTVSHPSDNRQVKSRKEFQNFDVATNLEKSQKNYCKSSSGSANSSIPKPELNRIKLFKRKIGDEIECQNSDIDAKTRKFQNQAGNNSVKTTLNIPSTFRKVKEKVCEKRKIDSKTASQNNDVDKRSQNGASSSSFLHPEGSTSKFEASKKRKLDKERINQSRDVAIKDTKSQREVSKNASESKILSISKSKAQSEKLGNKSSKAISDPKMIPSKNVNKLSRQNDEDIFENPIILNVFTCKYCESRFHSRFAYIKHIRDHTGADKFQCNICGHPIKSPWDLRLHLKANHPSVKNYQN